MTHNEELTTNPLYKVGEDIRLLESCGSYCGRITGRHWETDTWMYELNGTGIDYQEDMIKEKI